MYFDKVVLSKFIDLIGISAAISSYILNKVCLGYKACTSTYISMGMIEWLNCVSPHV